MGNGQKHAAGISAVDALGYLPLFFGFACFPWRGMSVVGLTLSKSASALSSGSGMRILLLSFAM